jgi:hypothetical protein
MRTGLALLRLAIDAGWRQRTTPGHHERLSGQQTGVRPCLVCAIIIFITHRRTIPAAMENVGDIDLAFLETFKTDTYQDLSLSDWLTHTPPALVVAHFNLSIEYIAKFPNDTPGVVPN